ncbi:8630e80d-6c07-451d-93b2-0056cb6c99ee [Sclerotinia trifoliorum]|uniref:8630e80d-6c07-451d-93b2-0056cb6c99ee n=1 Tax=Sclerotinia trifoliorum TaxID=28548 RepID=A0A8H2W6P0_9HELO|nr:8630e80d-6c07-451d-93b2-0056cb6c99ee [Sclerotinia trifoliorum]
MNSTHHPHNSLSEWISSKSQNVAFQSTSRIPIPTTNNSETSAIVDPPQPDLQKLIDGALFNEKIISTYPWTILGTVLVISGIHWIGRIKQWRRRVLRRRGERYTDDEVDDEVSKKIREDVTDCGSGSASSSRSSTLGSNTPSIKLDDRDEHIPLLANALPKNIPSYQSTVISRLKAFLIYQPRPIPYFNKVLPSNGSSIFILSFLALNIFYTFYRIPFSAFEASVLGDRAGLIFGVNLPLLYILGAKNQPLKILTGVSYESLNIIHRRLGELIMVAALIHAGGMFMMWYMFLKPFSGWTIWHFLTHPCIYLGLLALFTYKSLYVTSLASFRQRWYELFLGLHVMLQAAALIILYFHHPGTRTYVLWALVIFLVDRLGYRLCAKSIMAEAKVNIFPDNETMLLTFQLSQTSPTILSQTLGHSISTGWKATDHIFLTIPSLGRTHTLQAHPFTIASPAPHPSSKTSLLTLLIRSRSGFTSDLLLTAQLTNTLKCRLDGPYGSNHARSLLSDSDLAILIAGGSGIAVTWPLIHHLLGMSKEKENEDTENGMMHIVKGRKRRIVMIWIIHKREHLEWVDRGEREEVEKRGVEIIIPGATVEAGRPDLVGLMEMVVDGGNVRNGKSSYKKRSKRRTGVVVSGPDGLNRTINNKCAEFVKEGMDLKVTVEKFGW